MYIDSKVSVGILKFKQLSSVFLSVHVNNGLDCVVTNFHVNKCKCKYLFVSKLLVECRIHRKQEFLKQNVLHCKATNQLPTKLCSHEPIIDNPLTLANTNKCLSFQTKSVKRMAWHCKEEQLFSFPKKKLLRKPCFEIIQ